MCTDWRNLTVSRSLRMSFTVFDLFKSTSFTFDGNCYCVKQTRNFGLSFALKKLQMPHNLLFQASSATKAERNKTLTFATQIRQRKGSWGLKIVENPFSQQVVSSSPSLQKSLKNRVQYQFGHQYKLQWEGSDDYNETVLWWCS